MPKKHTRSLSSGSTSGSGTFSYGLPKKEPKTSWDGRAKTLVSHPSKNLNRAYGKQNLSSEKENKVPQTYIKTTGAKNTIGPEGTLFINPKNAFGYAKETKAGGPIEVVGLNIKASETTDSELLTILNQKIDLLADIVNIMNEYSNSTNKLIMKLLFVFSILSILYAISLFF